MMLVAWRDDGLWTLLWRAAWLLLTGGRKNDLPPPGFVGQISGLLADIGPRNIKRGSMTLSRTHFTPPAPAWRLTCVWDNHQRFPRTRPSGRYSVGGGGSPRADAGADSSGTRRVSSLTTSTWESKRLDSYARMTWNPDTGEYEYE